MTTLENTISMMQSLRGNVWTLPEYDRESRTYTICIT